MMGMFSCKEMAERATRGEFDDAGLLTRLLVRMHMAMCKHCRSYAAHMACIRDAVRKHAAGALSAEELEACKRRLKGRLAD